MIVVLYIIGGLLVASVLAYVVLIAMLAIGWKSTPLFQVTSDYAPTTKVSVIVAVRNEALTIEKCISGLLAQRYPHDLYEILIVDDHSEDNTAKIIDDKWGSNSLVKYVCLERGEGKKHAIAKGIEVATGTLIVTTDADCSFRQTWIQTIVQYYESNRPKMIVMPVLYSHKLNGFKSMQALEFMSLIGISGAAIGLQKPLLCNGANLAYTKEAYKKVHGFEGNSEVSSGDDVFLLHKIADESRSDVHYLKAEDVWVTTAPKNNLNSFFRQRLRWASKTPLYRDSWTLLVSYLVFSTNLLFLIGLAFSLFHLKMGLAVWLSFSVKCIIDIIFLFLVASAFRSERLLWYFLPVQLLYPIYVVVVAIGSVTTKTTWKGRNIN